MNQRAALVASQAGMASQGQMKVDVQPRKVVHNYHDFSHEKPELNDGSGKRTDEQNFPVKLHYMLCELEKDGLDYIVSWAVHGRCFIVHDQPTFVSKILPLWFRQSRYPSFQRQLNLYGFKRITAGRDKGAYYHELFLRGKRFLAHRIERVKVKGQGARKPSSPETEPNLYLLPYLPTKGDESYTMERQPSDLVRSMLREDPLLLNCGEKAARQDMLERLLLSSVLSESTFSVNLRVPRLICQAPRMHVTHQPQMNSTLLMVRAWQEQQRAPAGLHTPVSLPSCHGQLCKQEPNSLVAMASEVLLRGSGAKNSI